MGLSTHIQHRTLAHSILSSLFYYDCTLGTVMATRFQRTLNGSLLTEEKINDREQATNILYGVQARSREVVVDLRGQSDV